MDMVVPIAVLLSFIFGVAGRGGAGRAPRTARSVQHLARVAWRGGAAAGQLQLHRDARKHFLFSSWSSDKFIVLGRPKGPQAPGAAHFNAIDPTS